MLNYLDKKNRRDLGIAWLFAGVIFLVSGFSGGTVLILLGVLWLASANGRGLLMFHDNPDAMRNLLRRLTIGLLVLASLTLLVNAIQ